MVLLGPKRGRLDYALAGLRPGPHAVSVWLWFTPDETTLEMQGRLLVDGQPMLRFGPVLPPSGGGAVRLEVCLRLPAACTLSFENRKRPLVGQASRASPAWPCARTRTGSPSTSAGRPA